MATVDDLIRVSGYSRSTVFRCLAGKPVRDAARSAIRSAMHTTGFMAGREKNRDNDMLLISVPAEFRGFRGYADVVEGIMNRAEERGASVTFDEGQCTGKRTGAIILGKAILEEDKERSLRAAAGVPCVLVNRYIDEASASWASVNFRAATAMAVSRLGAAGCKHIACYGNANIRRVDSQMLEGAQQGAMNHDIDFLILNPAEGNLEEVCSRVLAGTKRVDGWLALNEIDALRVIGCAKRLGLSVPEDLSVIGMNDVEGAAYAIPSITSIHIPFRKCGYSAVDAVLRLLDEPDELSVKITLRHWLVERESCAPARAE